jgi:hypothetical protein
VSLDNISGKRSIEKNNGVVRDRKVVVSGTPKGKGTILLRQPPLKLYNISLFE